MRRYLQMSHASGHWAIYYDPGQDALLSDQVVVWALIDDDGASYVAGLVLDRGTNTLVPAGEYANYLATVANGDLKSMGEKLLAEGRKMKEWLHE